MKSPRISNIKIAAFNNKTGIRYFEGLRVEKKSKTPIGPHPHHFIDLVEVNETNITLIVPEGFCYQDQSITITLTAAIDSKNKTFESQFQVIESLVEPGGRAKTVLKYLSTVTKKHLCWTDFFQVMEEEQVELQNLFESLKGA